MNSNSESYSNHSKDRRNLLLLSMIIITNYYLSYTISELNFVGNELEIENPEMLYTLFVGVWFYFCFRHYQFFMSNKPFGIVSTFQDQIRQDLTQRICKDYDILEKDLYIKEYSKVGWLTHKLKPVDITEKTQKDTTEKIQKDITIIYLPKETARYYFKNILDMVFNNYSFTEVVFPFFIAVVSFIFILLQYFN